jgi:predicted phosphodiesterase
MRTAIVSDLHLGSAFGEDLLRDAGIRRVLIDELADADRLVLLGDVIELRELPLPTAMENARAFFEELGEAMAGRPVVLVPGNHDHRLAEPLLEQLALAGEPLALEHRAQPADEATSRIAAWLGDAPLELSYPGIWLREDVYATHGHYMDCHMSLPRLECIAAAATMRALRPLPAQPSPDNYEHVLRPVYGLTYGLAQGGVARRAARPSERAYRAIAGHNGMPRWRRAALRAAVPASVWAINRLLRADFDASLDGATISRNCVAAAAALGERLDLGPVHILTGHTHRGGPYERDAEWTLTGGGHLHNTGSWIFATAFHHPGTPPGSFWPGTVTWLEDEGPPRRTRLLLERPRDELQAVVDRLVAATAQALT